MLRLDAVYVVDGKGAKIACSEAGNLLHKAWVGLLCQFCELRTLLLERVCELCWVDLERIEIDGHLSGNGLEQRWAAIGAFVAPCYHLWHCGRGDGEDLLVLGKELEVAYSILRDSCLLRFDMILLL